MYSWLLYVHVLGVGAFLFAHGVSGGASFLLRGPVTPLTRPLLVLSQRSAFVTNPAILLVLITGVWMTFAGHWSTRIWPWAALGVLIVTFAAMMYAARPYYLARAAAKGADDELATRMAKTQPEFAAAVGVVALIILFGLMVFKPF